MERSTSGQQAVAARIPGRRLDRRRRAPSRTWSTAVLLVALALGTPLPQRSVAAVTIPVTTISDPWVRPAPAGGTTRAFLEIGSSVDATLVEVRSPVAAVRIVDGKKEVASLAVHAGTPLTLRAAGPHLVIGPLRAALARGERVPLVLVVRDAAGRAQEIAVQAEVRLRSALDDERRSHGGAHAPH